MFDGKVILVTGGTGSFAKQFIRTLLNSYQVKKIIVFSRDEFKQFLMQNQTPFNHESIRYFLGDVRDRDRLNLAMRGNVDYVVHTAALKQVQALEYNPFEAVKTNIIGSQNVIDASMTAGVEKVIALSTDKAVAPINLYGATKLAADKLFISANNYSGHHRPVFSIVRYGNVMGSRGSVIPFFLDKRDEGVFPITDERMTRFNITLQEGVNFVIDCLINMHGGESFVPKIPSVRIVDIATAIDPNLKFEIVGIRPGEKLHEELIGGNNTNDIIEFKGYYLILPELTFSGWSKDVYIRNADGEVGKSCAIGFSYNSGDNGDYLDVANLRKLIISEVPGGRVLQDREE